MKVKFVSLFFMFLFLVSCGSSPNTTESSKPAASPNTANRPEWTKIAEKVDKGDAVFFIGSSNDARNEDEAIKKAAQDAFNKVSNSFGVSVKSTMVDEQSSINGEDSYKLSIKSSLTGIPIEVKKYRIKEQYTERSGRGHNAFVLIAVPKSELERIQIEIDSFGVWALKSDLSESADKIRDLFPVFQSKGVNFNQEIEYSGKTADEIFKETKKAFYLKIECKETKAEEYNGEFYSVIQIKAELFDLMTGKTINRWTAEATGAAYSKDEAVSNGISKVVKEIIGQI